MTGFKMALVVGLFLFSTFANAKDIYVDPSAKSGGDGSPARPFNDLQKILNSGNVAGGDRVVLKPGHYGRLTLNKKNNQSAVILISEQKHRAVFSKIDIRDSDYWTLDGVKVLLDAHTPPKSRNLVDVETGSNNVIVRNSLILSAENTSDWGVEAWNTKVKSGIFSRGEGVEYSGNVIRNVNFGITAMGHNSIVKSNLIEDFAGDGLRGLGNDSLFEKNVVKNCHSVSKNHDDGFQSWSMNSNWKVGVSVVKNVVLRGNLFLANETPKNSPNCKMQGIGMFDGMFENWIIENNIVVVDHWHGLTVTGAKNVRITNNTVFDPTGRKPGPAWIRVEDHKNGKKSKGNLVANNLANSFQFPDGGVLQLQNQIIRNPHSLFVDPDNHDYRLKPGARAIDAGMDGVGPKVDFYGNPRPSGEKTDVGATEFVK